MTDQPTPCAGRWDLFDSTHPDHHHQAAQLCANCPTRDTCATLPTRDAVGTWAGVLHTPRRYDTDALNHHDAAWTDTELRAAHAAYQNGSRTPWARTGQTVYRRRLKQQQITTPPGAPGGRGRFRSTDRTTCADCGRTLVTARAAARGEPGVIHHADGLCRTCADRARRTA